MVTYLIVGAGAIGTVVAEELAEQGHSVRLLSRRGTGPEHAADRTSRGRRVRRRYRDPAREGRGRDLQLRQSGVPPLADRLATYRERDARRRRRERRRSRHPQQSLRLRSTDRSDDAARPAQRHVRKGPGARDDVARRQTCARRGPSPGHGGAGLGLHRSSLRELSRTAHPAHHRRARAVRSSATSTHRTVGTTPRTSRARW